MKLKFLLPLVLFFVMVGFLAKGLFLDPRKVPSPLIGKPAPAFVAPVLGSAGKVFSSADMKGKVWLLNTWASWCAACRDEHPLLVEMLAHDIPLYGLAYKDTDEASLQMLEQLGNPYILSATDADGRIGIDYGVYGVPETYVIDKEGIIRYKQIGPITPDSLRNIILPLLKDLQV
ncbi:MAG: DsbE family thiol:disulfide interchange protein [Methylophilaceae bacterium]|jgi:cytochrome c biogenesis protein CcmG, thiol:disulfide interchange protein DsbE|nr:MAG: DsbE family thiol:disulfide interchange protein [Methylophilaceae bacterium]